MNLLGAIKTSPWAQALRQVKCSSDTCGRWLTQRQLASRSVGVKMEGRWYCSYRCFRPAAQHSYAHLLSKTPFHPVASIRPSFATALLRRGLLSDAEYKSAQRQQCETGNDLGDILVQRGSLTALQVISARAEHWGCPVFPESSEVARSSFRIPFALVQHYAMVPLHYASTGGRLFVGFVRELNYQALYTVEQVMGRATQPCFISESAFQRIVAVSSNDDRQEREIGARHSARQMSHDLCSFGSAMDADQISTAISGRFSWSRLRSGTKIGDLIFTNACSHEMHSQAIGPLIAS